MAGSLWATTLAAYVGTGELRYNWSNVCMHYFSRSFLERAADFLASGRGSYHVAKKSIPSKDGPVQVSQTSMSASSLLFWFQLTHVE